MTLVKNTFLISMSFIGVCAYAITVILVASGATMKTSYPLGFLIFSVVSPICLVILVYKLGYKRANAARAVVTKAETA